MNNLLGSGITVDPGSIQYTGGAGASGIFTDGLSSGIGIDSGIILTTGQATSALGPNSGDSNGTNNGLSGSAELDALCIFCKGSQGKGYSWGRVRPQKVQSMVYCLNPNCAKPHNPEDSQFCLCCGTQIRLKDQYLPLYPLGQGGFGRTFFGVDEHLPSKPSCVIKQLHHQQNNPALIQKILSLFNQEAERLEQLGNHRQIPQLFAYFQQQEQFYLIQEFIDGETLRDKILSEEQIWQLLQDVLPILQYIHGHQIIHRDIKPDNIIRRHQDQKCVLIDFGVSRMLTDTAIIGGATIIGTPGYMAPEQLQGKVLPASDLYSLGVTCLRLLTGIDPQDMYDVIEEKWCWQQYLPSGTLLTPKLTRILERLVAPSLHQRYRSAIEVLQTLGTVTWSQVPSTLTRLTVPTQAIQTSISQPKPLPSPIPNSWLTPSSEEDLIEIDYATLKTYLSRRKWEQADQETWNILCRLVKKRDGKYLSDSDIQKFPCEHLLMLDSLWLQYSRGRFGFTVQGEIYREVGGEYHLFCDRVGWSGHRSTPSSSNFQFNFKAPPGHLPSRRWVGGYAWWSHAKVFATKLDECEIYPI